MNPNRGILLLEDDVTGVNIVKLAFKINNINNPLYVTKKSKDALNFLRRQVNYADRAASCKP